MRRRPNLFHVGHPRSGTGTVYGWLAQHPDVHMARKELHYFGEDIGFNAPRRTIGNYLRHFEGADRQRWVGDSSTWYLASTEAAREIAAYAVDARVIVNLREPVSFLESLHAHLLANGDEDRADLKSALNSEPERRAGQSIPSGSLPALALHYLRHCRYSELIERYFRYFGRDRVQVLLFDDLASDPAGTYRGLFEFLGVASDPPMLSARKRRKDKNASWGVRSRTMQTFLKRPSQQAIYMGLRPEPVPGWNLVLRGLRRINRVALSRVEADRALRTELRTMLLPEVERLDSLLGRDLSAWKGSVSAARAIPAER